MAEVRVGRARSNDQVIVGHFHVGKYHELSCEIKADNLAKKDFNVIVTSQNPADWSRDFCGRNTGSGDLIKKRLKGVMVLAVNNCDFDRQLRNVTSRFEPAKSGSDDNYTRPAFVHEDLLSSDALRGRKHLNVI
jgi:hypothetical protein